MASDDKPKPSDAPTSDPGEPEDNDAADKIDDAHRTQRAQPHSQRPKAAATDAHDHEPSHAAHGDAHSHDHGLAHTTPVSLLFGILAVLLVLTIATVAVTSFDLGAQGNLIVAMLIATVKAGLVVTFFMHLLWDKKFNLVLFLTSVLFLILFLSMATTDRSEYQHLVDEFRASQLAK